MLRSGFFNNVVIYPDFQGCGNTPDSNDLFAVLLITIGNSLVHDFSSDIGIASSGDDFVGAARISCCA